MANPKWREILITVQKLVGICCRFIVPLINARLLKRLIPDARLYVLDGGVAGCDPVGESSWVALVDCV